MNEGRLGRAFSMCRVGLRVARKESRAAGWEEGLRESRKGMGSTFRVPPRVRDIRRGKAPARDRHPFGDTRGRGLKTKRCLQGGGKGGTNCILPS